MRGKIAKALKKLSGGNRKTYQSLKQRWVKNKSSIVQFVKQRRIDG